MLLDSVIVLVHFAIKCVCSIVRATGDSITELEKYFNQRCVEPQWLSKTLRATIVRRPTAGRPVHRNPAPKPPAPPARQAPAGNLRGVVTGCRF